MANKKTEGKKTEVKKTEDKKNGTVNVQEQIKETIIDVRNEAIVQSANLYLLARKVLLAGMGAVALTMEEAQEFVEKLVERGEIAETDAQKLMQELRKRAQRGEKEVVKASKKAEKKAEKKAAKTAEDVEKTAVKMAKKAEGALEDTVETVLKSLNVPSKTDVDDLSKKIGELSRKVDALRS